jgi:hypothetical protein
MPAIMMISHRDQCPARRCARTRNMARVAPPPMSADVNAMSWDTLVRPATSSGGSRAPGQSRQKSTTTQGCRSDDVRFTRDSTQSTTSTDAFHFLKWPLTQE